MMKKIFFLKYLKADALSSLMKGAQNLAELFAACGLQMWPQAAPASKQGLRRRRPPNVAAGDAGLQTWPQATPA
jgi:hypothetical protein